MPAWLTPDPHQDDQGQDSAGPDAVREQPNRIGGRRLSDLRGPLLAVAAGRDGHVRVQPEQVVRARQRGNGASTSIDLDI